MWKFSNILKLSASFWGLLLVEKIVPQNFRQFPSIGSDDPPPLGVENVKIRKILKKSGDLRGTLRDPLQPFLGP